MNNLEGVVEIEADFERWAVVECIVKTDASGPVPEPSTVESLSLLVSPPMSVRHAFLFGGCATRSSCCVAQFGASRCKACCGSNPARRKR